MDLVHVEDEVMVYVNAELRVATAGALSSYDFHGHFVKIHSGLVIIDILLTSEI